MIVQSAAPQSPVTVEELSAFLGLDDLSPADAQYALLDGLLLSASYSAEKYLNVSIDRRRFTWNGAVPFNGLGGIRPTYKIQPIELPYAYEVELESVTDGTVPLEETEYTLTRDSLLVRHAYDVLVVTYDTGYSEVPEPVRTAIMSLAAYLYEHRGACDADDALMQSGAGAILRPFRRVLM